MENKKVKVLHIMPGYGGGISSYVRNVVNSLNCDKIIIDVASFSKYSNDFNDEINRKCGKTFTLPSIRKDGIFEIINYYRNILLEYGPYDMIHCHFSGLKGLFFSLLSRLCGVKRIAIHAHRSSNENIRKFDFILIKLSQIISRLSADNLVSCSKMASKFIFGEKSLSENRVMHMPNSIYLEKYCCEIDEKIKSKILEELKINNRQLIIGHVGRFNTQKNHIYMIELIKKMKEKKIDFVWIFIGEGELEKTIKQKLNNNNCQEYVRFLGRREDVNVLYNILDVMVLPSFFEGLPTVTVEAQAAGVPSVVSDYITKEVDMNMGLVEYISLDADIDVWIDSITNAKNIKIINREERIKIIKNRGFTTESAAKLYEEFVFNKRKSFNLGDSM